MDKLLKRSFSSLPKKDLYKIFGVSRDADASVIKSRFIDLAKCNHPDIHPQNEELFKQINEAYSVLSKPDKKTVYDQFYDQYISQKIPNKSVSDFSPQKFYSGVF